MLILALVSILVISHQQRPEIGFRTLSDGKPAVAARAQLRVIFDAGSAEREIRDLLRSVNGEIIGGPSPTGVYTLQIRLTERIGDEPAATVAELRSSPIVRFAEPLPSEVK
jgi:hypothetical protein